MSFIFEDKKLVKQLLQSGTDFELKFSKQGQATQNLNNLNALLSHLRDQMTTTPGRIDTGSDLSSAHMSSLGDYLLWLATTSSIVIPVKPEDTAPPNRNYIFVKIDPTTKTVRAASLTARDRQGYWLDVPSLKKNLAALQNDPELKGKTKFQIQFSKLLQDLSNQLDQEITEQPATEKGVAPSVPAKDKPPLYETVDSLPLFQDRIDFNRIDDFFSNIGKIDKLGNNASVSRTMGEAVEAMSKATGMTHNDRIFQLNFEFQDFIDAYIPGKIPGATYSQLIYLLKVVVTNVFKVISAFNSQYGDYLSKEDPKLAEKIHQQIGQYPGDDSIGAQNLKILNRLSDVKKTSPIKG